MVHWDIHYFHLVLIIAVLLYFFWFWCIFNYFTLLLRKLGYFFFKGRHFWFLILLALDLHLFAWLLILFTLNLHLFAWFFNFLLERGRCLFDNLFLLGLFVFLCWFFPILIRLIFFLLTWYIFNDCLFFLNFFLSSPFLLFLNLMSLAWIFNFLGTFKTSIELLDHTGDILQILKRFPGALIIRIVFPLNFVFNFPWINEIGTCVLIDSFHDDLLNLIHNLVFHVLSLIKNDILLKKNFLTYLCSKLFVLINFHKVLMQM